MKTLATIRRVTPTVRRQASSKRTTRQIPRITSGGVGESTKAILVENREKFMTVYREMNKVKATKKVSRTFPPRPPLARG
jgi:hypothetical protein